ncbi:beta-1,3-glucanase family protein [Streptomyces vinaceus]|uniref:beta-1,3-glucanase family protein n=1 Tax=Streptomyces vinaceus TaxID=1960 RepID=UPI0035DF9D3E
MLAVPALSLADATFAHAADSAPTAPATDMPGGFPLNIKTNGDKSYWVTIIGQQTPGHYSYVDSRGTVHSVAQQGVDGMSFQLSGSEAQIQLPAHLEGGRIYLSEKAMLMPAAKDGAGRPSDVGYVQPDLNNPSDPNQGNPYDFFEFTFENGKINFGGNTSQVDGFSIPMTAELKQDASGFDKTVGIKGMTAQDVIAEYKKDTEGTPFADIISADGKHITAPRSAAAFRAGGAGAGYFDGPITQAWNAWKDKDFKLTDGNNVYTGKTGGAGKDLTFTKTVGGQVVDKGSVAMPTTADVVACNGALASGSDADKFVEARLCAAFNRGIAENDPASWNDAASYYPAGKESNKYAAFFHKISLDNLAYGFAYDDVYDKSSVMILPNSEAPTSLTLTLGG